MAKQQGIELKADGVLSVGGKTYNPVYNRLQNMEVRYFDGGFKCLPVVCRKKGIWGNSDVTFYFHNDKVALAAFKKSLQGKQNKEIVKNAIFVKQDIHEVGNQLIKQAKRMEQERIEREQKRKEKIRNISLENVYDYHEVRGEMDLILQKGAAEPVSLIIWGFTYYFYSYEDFHNFWNVMQIKYPVGDVSSNECEEKSIACAVTKEAIFTDGTKEQVFELMSACLIGYQQIELKLYPETDFVKACMKLYQTCGIVRGFETAYHQFVAVYQSLDTIGNLIQVMLGDGDIFSENIISSSCCSTVVPIKPAQQQTEADKRQEAGRAGESLVEYVLKWLHGSGFQSIGNRVRLKNLAFMDESQEYDHLLIFSGGIVCIETKNLGGKITITESGQWIQEKGMERKGMESPVFQVDRHHALLASIIGDIPLYDVICIANQGCEIAGAEHCPVPVVKYDMLQRHLMQLPDAVHLNVEQMQEVIQTIERHKV